MRAGLLFAGLFAAALIATGLVFAVRSPELVLEVPRLPDRISPDGDGRREVAEITFFVRESDPDASVFIVGRDLAEVATLDQSASLTENERVTYVWDGRTDSGQTAPPGRYRLRVVLPNRDRDMVFPRRIELVGG